MLSFEILPSMLSVTAIYSFISFLFQTIGAAFFLKQWGPYNVAVWVRFKQMLEQVDGVPLHISAHIKIPHVFLQSSSIELLPVKVSRF